MVNQSLTPEGGGLGGGDQACATMKAPHSEMLAVTHQSHCGGWGGVNAEPSQVAFSGKKIQWEESLAKYCDNSRGEIQVNPLNSQPRSNF